MALAAGCASSAPATPTPTATPSPETTHGAPAIAFDKLWVELGTVARDQQGIQTFLVMNRGDSPLQLEQVSIQVEQGCDAAEVDEERSAEIQPGEAWFLPIKLGQHQELGPHRLLVKVSSNDPDRPLATLGMYFEVAEAPPAPGPGPRLRVDKEMVAIGTVPYDWPLYEQFTLRNDGDQPLVLEFPEGALAAREAWGEVSEGVLAARIEEGC